MSDSLPLPPEPDLVAAIRDVFQLDAYDALPETHVDDMLTHLIALVRPNYGDPADT